MKTQKLKLIAAMVSLACSLSAHAVLERVGPTSIAPAIGGFPAWYQDTTGLTLEFCDPQNATELSGGWCRLLAADVPTLPEAFPNAFAPEHFYFSGDAGVKLANGGAGSLILGLEAGFAGGAPAPGEHIAFARIRVKITSLPMTGKYRIIHPYGEELLDGVAGDRIFFSDDVGFICVEDFTCALSSRMGPFLLPAATPGGAELPAVTGPVPGKQYLADPLRRGPVTGSVLPDFVDSAGTLRNHNIFRIEGPAGSGIGGPGIDYLETTDFTLQGRIHTGGIPGQVRVDRASYARSAAGNKLDVFAQAQPTTQSRLPTQPMPAAVQPQLSFFDAPCGGVVNALGIVLPPYTAPVGATESIMFADGTHQWGQGKPAAIPAAVCVKDAAARDPLGNIVPAYYAHQVSDDVTISQAHYDPAAGSLTVAAASSDTLVPPTLSLAFGTFRGDLVNGSLVVPVGIAPPDVGRVLSSAFGVNDARVTIGAATGAAPAGVPVAVNDSYTFLEDAPPQTLAVLANDTNAVGGKVTITSPPHFGTAAANVNGTVTYTPNLNANGTDAFTYTVTVGTAVSNTANVVLNITPVNDPPVAVADTANALVNVLQTINVLANDTDPDGFADIVAAVNVTPPVPAGATATAAGRVVTFTAPAVGTYTFTYQAQDAAGALSNPATVTVQVAAAETLVVQSARFVPRLSRLRVVGTLTPVAGQTITSEYANAAGATFGVVGSTTPLPDGTWTVEKLGLTALPAGTTWIKTTTSNGSVNLTPLK
ncbi:Ig-like domain-containing protein [Azoarcus sp. DN11]|uniref:Ig-like domain-containing protein n=1 Tax=Azoarcus sp. DN11 TaxID=356837 RepID=UPI000EB04D7A|nr:Ig-like domain-containing protein [Azoarcus sp. DN11]AYH46111.1 hypothetical protein CDA09_22495 [Azoarcus sp. DN11]